MEQTYFKYNLKPSFAIDNYFVGKTNIEAYNSLIKKNLNQDNFLLIGPKKSGKTHLSLIWKEKFNAILYKNNFSQIINEKKNIIIDDVFINLNEEQVFHIINHCKLFNLKILITSDIFPNDFNFNLEDLSSRLKSFFNINIDLPDDELLFNLMVKLFHDKQIIIKNDEIFSYILKRVHRSYERVFLLIDKIDQLLLKENKQLTIPLIKKLI